MTRTEQIDYLIQRLLEDMPQYREQAAQFPADEISRRRLLRSLMNVRPPMPLKAEFWPFRTRCCPPRRRTGARRMRRSCLHQPCPALSCGRATSRG
jgi:hypothetical protein